MNKYDGIPHHRGARWDTGHRLIEHGIQTEVADWRAHVCVNAGKIYFFKPEAALEAIAEGKAKARTAGQRVNGRQQVTAYGYIVPVAAIKGIVEVDARAEISLFKWDSFRERGDNAEAIVHALIVMGFTPLGSDTLVWEQPKGSKGQFEGIDLNVESNGVVQTVQVKCDMRGGYRAGVRCTGNLFIQTSERNPNRVS